MDHRRLPPLVVATRLPPLESGPSRRGQPLVLDREQVSLQRSRRRRRQQRLLHLRPTGRLPRRLPWPRGGLRLLFFRQQAPVEEARRTRRRSYVPAPLKTLLPMTTRRKTGVRLKPAMHFKVRTRAFQNPGFSAESGIYPDISGCIRWNLLAIKCESKTEDTAGKLTSCSGSSWKH